MAHGHVVCLRAVTEWLAADQDCGVGSGPAAVERLGLFWWGRLPWAILRPGALRAGETQRIRGDGRSGGGSVVGWEQWGVCGGC